MLSSGQGQIQIEMSNKFQSWFYMQKFNNLHHYFPIYLSIFQQQHSDIT